MGLSFEEMDYLDMGVELSGYRLSFNESPGYDFLQKNLTNSIQIGLLLALNPLPFSNSLVNLSYTNLINDKDSLGGYYSRLRGIQQGEITTDNRIIINLENRFKLAADFLWGRWAIAIFSDLAWSFDQFDFGQSRFLTGAGLGLRYRSNLISTTFKIDCAWNLAKLSQFPEIMFTMGELIQ